VNRPVPRAARLNGPPIEVLAPNGDRHPFHPGCAVPLGAALHIVEPFQVHDTEQLYDVALSSPWAPIAVRIRDNDAFAALLGAWRSGHRLNRLVTLPEQGVGDVHVAVHRILRTTEPPTADAVASCITVRVGSAELGATILAELCGKRAPSRQARHARFIRAGSLRAKEWKDLFRLTRALCEGHETTIDAIAGAVDRDTRTLRAISDRLLGIPISAARTGFGWRWAVELVLQRHGYLEGSDPVSVAVGAPSTRALERALMSGRSRAPLRDASA
jgi:hypothetical protein